MESVTKNDKTQNINMAPQASKTSENKSDGKDGKTTEEKVMLKWKSDFVLPGGHRYVDLEKNVEKKPKEFIQFAKKLAKDGLYAISEKHGQFYKSVGERYPDGTIKIHTEAILDGQWKLPKKLEQLNDPWKKDDKKDDKASAGKNSWADQTELENMKDNLLGNSNQFDGFGNGAALPVDKEKIILEELEKKDQVEGQTGKPKYAQLLEGVDVVKLVVKHLWYKPGENFPKPPTWNEYRQLLFDIMKLDSDDIETFTPSRFGQQAGQWFVCIRLKKDLNLKQTYEKVKGCFTFGLKVAQNGTAEYVPRWQAKIDGFEPEEKIERKKFKLRLSKELGIKPHMVLSAARKVMKVMGRGILKERYDVNTGLVDKKGVGLGTGIYYFYVQKEENVNYPTYLDVNGYQIKIWTPERDLDFEQWLAENPRMPRSDFESTRYEKKIKENSEPKKPAPIINDFTPDFRAIIEEQLRQDNEKKLKQQKEKHEMEEAKRRAGLRKEGNEDLVTEGGKATKITETAADEDSEGEEIVLNAVSNTSTPINHDDSKKEFNKETIPMNDVSMGNKSESDEDTKSDDEPNESGGSNETVTAKRNREQASLDATNSTEKQPRKIANLDTSNGGSGDSDSDEVSDGDNDDKEENKEKVDADQNGSEAVDFDDLPLSAKTHRNEVAKGTKDENDSYQTPKLDRFITLINMESKQLSTEEIKEVLEIAEARTKTGQKITAEKRDTWVRYFNIVKDDREKVIKKLEADQKKVVEAAEEAETAPKRQGFIGGLASFLG